MDRIGADTVVPVNDDPTMGTRPLMDFSAGYVQRAIADLPKQGTREPWHLAMSYYQDARHLRDGAIEHPQLRFSNSARTTDRPAGDQVEIAA
jgi:hypothetical protein